MIKPPLHWRQRIPSWLQLTATGETEKALVAAQQRVTELTAELETKRKAAEEAEAKRKEAEMLVAT